ncbi:hypothetical protein JG688_00008193 [Phytophthora aleatoria]|uniref:Uncharacterized protein n=1 Tax=Phytophthora aleatoria TaxID=2496075 RepID=A0A8J5J8F4_9STRA|nr:hypothetical protein JG688_00008193 [Phytophthora aleatoria]
MLNCRGTSGELNALAIEIGSRLHDGLSMSLSASGDAFFIGIASRGKPVTSNRAGELQNFLNKSKDFYPVHVCTKEQREEKFYSWIRSRHSERGCLWLGNAGINLYQTDPFQCAWLVVDHRIP